MCWVSFQVLFETSRCFSLHCKVNPVLPCKDSLLDWLQWNGNLTAKPRLASISLVVIWTSCPKFTTADRLEVCRLGIKCSSRWTECSTLNLCTFTTLKNTNFSYRFMIVQYFGRNGRSIESVAIQGVPFPFVSFRPRGTRLLESWQVIFPGDNSD